MSDPEKLNFMIRRFKDLIFDTSFGRLQDFIEDSTEKYMVTEQETDENADQSFI